MGTVLCERTDIGKNTVKWKRHTLYFGSAEERKLLLLLMLQIAGEMLTEKKCTIKSAREFQQFLCTRAGKKPHVAALFSMKLWVPWEK